jgi:hypothetical protein
MTNAAARIRREKCHWVVRKRLPENTQIKRAHGIRPEAAIPEIQACSWGTYIELNERPNPVYLP